MKVWFGLLYFTLVIGLAAVPGGTASALNPKPAAEETARAQETAAAARTVAAEATIDAFRAQVSKAYMNCLFEADEALEGLASNPQARGAEEKAHRAFCLTRKESCLARGNDADCMVFIEDFIE